MNKFYEFFAGGGMARAGLGEGWSCQFANDFDRKKGKSYKDNWSDENLRIGDIRAVETSDLPGTADLAWASFPCQDLSLAGGGAGLKGERSGTFWPFWAQMEKLIKEGRGPRIIALENVTGALTSHQGKDFAAICESFNKVGYRCGAVVVDAALFVPQSRPRLFIIGIRKDLDIPSKMISDQPSEWHTKTLMTAHKKLKVKERENWLWWRFPAPLIRNSQFADLIEDKPKSVSWHEKHETQKLLSMMSKINLAKVEAAKKTGRKMVGAIYKRTRRDEFGRKVQRAEVRFDDLAGCLRTPAGGSSRQLILVVEGRKIRSRLISARETARLMGLPDEYLLPNKYNEAYHLTGDGVAVPVVRHLAEHLFEPLLKTNKKIRRAAA